VGDKGLADVVAGGGFFLPEVVRFPEVADDNFRANCCSAKRAFSIGFSTWFQYHKALDILLNSQTISQNGERGENTPMSAMHDDEMGTYDTPMPDLI